jgi:hypothetical protein
MSNKAHDIGSGQAGEHDRSRAEAMTEEVADERNVVDDCGS